MKDKIIVIRIPFSVRNQKRELNIEWNKVRIKMFVNYTLKSLKAQVNQDFITLVKCRDDMINFIMGEINKITTLPDNVIFIRASKEMAYLKKAITGYKYFYYVRLDSDDMYHKTYINMLHEYRPKKDTQALINQKGYIYDLISKRMAKFGYESPPYFVLVYKTEDYLKGFNYPLPEGHGSAKRLKYEALGENNFMTVLHTHNKSSSFEHLARFIGKMIETDKESILKEFGIEGDGHE